MNDMNDLDGYIDDIDGVNEDELSGFHEKEVLLEFEKTEPPQWERDVMNEGIKTFEHAARYVTGVMKKEFAVHGETLKYEAMNDPEGFLSPAEFAAALCFMQRERIERNNYHERNAFRNLTKMEETLTDIEKRLEKLL